MNSDSPNTADIVELAESFEAEARRVNKFKGSTDFTTYWEGYAEAYTKAAQSVRALKDHRKAQT